jgi:hypothetical protein
MPGKAKYPTKGSFSTLTHTSIHAMNFKVGEIAWWNAYSIFNRGLVEVINPYTNDAQNVVIQILNGGTRHGQVRLVAKYRLSKYNKHATYI